MGAEAMFKMAFEDGFSHDDSHPANLVLTPQGELALFDNSLLGSSVAAACVGYAVGLLQRRRVVRSTGGRAVRKPELAA